MAASKTLSVKALEEKVQGTPGSYAFARLADAYRKRGDIVSAITMCKEGIRRHPTYPTGRIILARCYLEQENLPEAITEFQNVCRIDRRNIIALKMLADIFVKQGNPEKAGDIYALCARLDPHNSSFTRLASEYQGSGARGIFTILGITPDQAVSPSPVRIQPETDSDFSKTPHLETLQPYSEPEEASPDFESLGIVPEAEIGSLQDSEFMIEETVDDIHEGSGMSVSGSDIGQRMSLLFGAEADDELQKDELEQTIALHRTQDGSITLGDSIAEPEVDFSSLEISESTGTSAFAADDISSRVEEMFSGQSNLDRAILMDEAAETHGVVDMFDSPSDLFAPSQPSTAQDEVFTSATNEYAQVIAHSEPSVPFEDSLIPQESFEEIGTTTTSLPQASMDILSSDDVTSQTRVYSLPVNQNVFASPSPESEDPLAAISGVDVTARIEELFSDNETFPTDTARAPALGVFVPETAEDMFAPIDTDTRGTDTSAISFDSLMPMPQDSRDASAQALHPPTEALQNDDLFVDRASPTSANETALAEDLFEEKEHIESDSVSDTAYASAQELLSGATIPLSGKDIQKIQREMGVGQDFQSNDVGADEISDVSLNTTASIAHDIVAQSDELSIDEVLQDEHVMFDTDTHAYHPVDSLDAHTDEMPTGDEIAHILDSVFSEESVDDPGVSHDMMSMPQPIVGEDTIHDNGITQEMDLGDILDTVTSAPESTVTPVAGDDIESRLSEMFPGDGISAELDATLIPDDDDADITAASAGFYNVAGEDAFDQDHDQGEITQAYQFSEDADATLAFGELSADDTITHELAHAHVDPMDMSHATEIKATNEVPENTYSIPDHVITPTLADIYFQQGQPLLALEIYKRILARDPDSTRIKARIQEIQRSMTDEDYPLGTQASSEQVFSDSDTQSFARPVFSEEDMPLLPRTRKKPQLPHDKPLKGVRIRKKPRPKVD